MQVTDLRDWLVDLETGEGKPHGTEAGLSLPDQVMDDSEAALAEPVPTQRGSASAG